MEKDDILKPASSLQSTEDEFITSVNFSPEKESRLERHKEKTAIRNIIIVVVGIILLALFLFFFGIPLLIGFSYLGTNNIINKQAVTPTQEMMFIEAPVLDEPFEATNSAQISIGGSARIGEKIVLYNNDKKVGTVNVKKDKSFVFPVVKLEEGGNILKAKALLKTQESDYSEPLIITYITGNPTVEITFPQEGETLKKDITIMLKGSTDINNTVSVNGTRAIVQSNGIFSATLPIHEGENTFTIVVTDEAGNSVTKELKVKAE